MTCEITGCIKPTKSRGLCNMHYLRWWKYGDPNASRVPERRICSIEDCTSPHLARGMCGKHYQRWAQHGDASVSQRERSVLDRISEKIHFAENGCWEWLGARKGKGYGMVGSKGKVHNAHRFIYELLVESVPKTLQIDHLCFNQCCVNPDHLEPVTPLENTRRMLAHARA